MRAMMFVVMAAALGLGAAAHAAPAREIKDIVYARVDGIDLALDLYLPANVTAPPLIVWVHGGAWSSGDKSGYPEALLNQGFAFASVDFRQTTQARFPAQVHDIKGAIRFLRANSAKYGYAPQRIAISGASSGGHLAALVGVTNGNKALEGNVGGNLGQSSDVQAILDYYGASNLTTILAQSTPYGLSVRKPALDRLLGGQPDAVPELARLASPVLHVDRNDPPLLLLHGDQDPQMPIDQSRELDAAYRKLGLDVDLDVVRGARHGGPEFYAPAHLQRALAFLRRTIGR